MQTIRIRGTKDDFDVQEMVYPFIENGIFYLRMIEINEEGKPIHFLTIVPHDVLWRRSDYDEEIMQEIHAASDNALKEQIARMAEMQEPESEPELEDESDCRNYYG